MEEMNFTELFQLLSVHGRDGGGATRNLKLQVRHWYVKTVTKMMLEVVNGDGEERGVLKLIEGSTLNLTCSVASPKEGEVRGSQLRNLLKLTST